MRNSRSFSAAAVAALAALVLAGCASADVASTPSPQAPSPSASPTEDPATGPQTVFDGDCGRLLSEADAATIAGGPVALATPLYEVGDVAIRQLGGIFCAWSDPAGQPGSFLSLVVIPARAGAQPTEDYCDPDFGCSFFSSASDFDLFGVVRGGDTNVPQLPLAAAATEAFAAAVASEDVPEAYAPASAWATPVDCPTLDASGVVAAALGVPQVEGFLTGGDAEPNAGFVAAQVAAGGALCAWNADSGNVSANVLPGGAWIAEELAASEGAQPVTVDGVDSALVIDEFLHLFDGDNWIAVAATLGETPMDEAALGALATALIAELDVR